MEYQLTEEMREEVAGRLNVDSFNPTSIRFNVDAKFDFDTLTDENVVDLLVDLLSCDDPKVFADGVDQYVITSNGGALQ